MKAERKIYGIHHITAITPSASENLRFYETALGLRLVKQTVNFDDPYTYHLYYGDATGSPGTVLTFFPWENLPKGSLGSGMVTAISFAIPRPSIDFWKQRLASKEIPIQTIERFGEPVIQFSDPHGLPLELTGTGTLQPNGHWKNSSIAEPCAITGFHSATATLKSIKASETLLVDVMGLRLINQEQNRYRFQMNGSAPGSYYDIVEDPKAPSGRQGGGTVHHIAFRTQNHTTQLGWRSTLDASGITVTNVRDRKYFQSIYFNAPEGVLFEIATDTPGFSIDEPVDALGETLKLPEQFERMRGDIERNLPLLRPQAYRHVFHAPQEEIDDGSTLVTLHGTGGNEHDLVPLAVEASRSSAILSPRGNVLENGMWRFFKRLANNIFDETDVVKRANELSDFIISAVTEYGRDPSRLTALGYSNGANIAAAILMLRPELFSKAVLLRPMLPLQNAGVPALKDKPILIVRGEHDTVIPSESTDQLESLLQSAGADVTTQTINAGHGITDQELTIISRWLTSLGDNLHGAEFTAATKLIA